jgi:hypothetical protein
VDRARSGVTRGARGRLRIATANVRDALPASEARESLRLVADQVPDLIGLQEWSILRRRLLHEAAPRYAWCSPVLGGCAVGVRRDRFEVLRRRTRVLSRPGWGARVPGKWRPEPGRVAGIVVCRDRDSDRTIAMISFHLVPGVQHRGEYRQERRHLVQRHRHEAAQLGRLVTELMDEGHLVCAAGDSNFHGFRLPGLVSCWTGHSAAGTLGTRLVDAVFWPTAATSVTLVATPSDHRAVISSVAVR